MSVNLQLSPLPYLWLLYTSDAADEEDSGDLGGRRIIKKKKKEDMMFGDLYNDRVHMIASLRD